MKRYLSLAAAALLIPATAMGGTVYTRAWCKDSVHGGPGPGAGAYPWISRVYVGSTSDDCWRFVREHEGEYAGHKAGCSYVTSGGNIT